MSIDDYIATLRKETAKQYRTTALYLECWQEDKEQFPTFSEYLGTLELAHNTRAKHVRHARTLCKRCGLDYQIDPMQSEYKSPPKFSDDDFQGLIGAFADCQYPKFIIGGERHRYWETVIHFAAVTALRRQAILGLKLSDINFDELFVTIPPGIDKKGKERYKPITAELASDIVELRRFYDTSQLKAAQSGLLFPWIHGNKKWYECWNCAEQKLGKRFHLHDLKRFSGELALRAGATPMELQQHMDHADLKTTMLHYCRPATTEMVRKIKVPLPNRRQRQTPLFTEPELKTIIEGQIIRKLIEVGVDTSTIRFVLDSYGVPDFGDSLCEKSPGISRPRAARIVKSEQRTPKSATQLRVFWGDEEGGES